MLTKFYLHYDNIQYELKDDDLYNWDEIRCSYKRGNYDGVVRSFSSQFFFVNQAREILMKLYIRDRYNAKAYISVHTITDRWEWEQKFLCPLDFSTISWERFILKINAVDNSLAALIKANKSTKYEMEIGTDIMPDGTFLFNRLPIRNGLTYEITGGASNEIDGSLILHTPENRRIYCGVVRSDEIYIPGTVLWEEDQNTDTDSYMVEARETLEMDVEVNCVFDQCFVSGNTGFRIELTVLREDGSSQMLPIGSPQTMMICPAQPKFFCGTYNSVEELITKYPPYENGTAHAEYWATIQGTVWAVEIRRGTDSTASWECQNTTADNYRRKSVSMKTTVTLNAGDRIALTAEGGKAKIYESTINFGWIAKGSPCHVASFEPRTVAEALLRRISDNRINPRVDISGYDPRLAKTTIMSAESVRGIGNAKIYTSFSELCDWMSTVFGYIYLIGEEMESQFVLFKQAFGGLNLATPYPVQTDPWENYNGLVPSVDDIFYFSHVGKFVAFDGQQWFDNFPGDSDYNDKRTGHPRTDVLFSIRRYKNGSFGTGLYYWGGASLEEYRGSASDVNKKFQVFRFVHRSELFSSSSIKTINNADGFNYNIDTGVIYSAVTAGYDKKDYESVNGRDEWNFNNTYTTGCSVSDKTLSLLSKYRADCYGIEFAAQKRGANSTDTSADHDVFFVYCRKGDGGLLIPDTSAEIQNAISNEVFNGVFSPMECIRANAGYIGLQAEDMTLKFASSTGNSEIVIDGEPMSADITLNTPLATSGWVEFTTDDVEDIANVDELVEVVDKEGTLYRGYLKEVDVKYAKTEAVKYKLIIKEIERW